MNKRMTVTVATGGLVVVTGAAGAFAFQSPDWTHALKEFGLPIFYLLVTLYLGWKIFDKLWPYVLEKDKANAASQERFTEAVREMSKTNAEAYGKLTEAINEMRHDMRERRQ